jgi:ABC-type lipoprotein release transport system permease subunit
MTRFVFTIKWDTRETEVYNTVPDAKYFSEVLQFNEGQNQMILTTSLAYASQVKAGDKVAILTDNDVNRIIHFIETVAPSEEETKELDRT